MGDKLKKMENQIKKIRWIKPKFTKVSNEDDMHQKMTSKYQIYQQPLVGSFSNFELKLSGPNQSKYLSNHWSDLTQV